MSSIRIYIVVIILFQSIPTPVNGQNGVWTWMKGTTVPDFPGNYGIQNVPSPANEPPALYEAAEWTDLNGNFWIFGGILTGSSGGVYNSALWRFDPITNNWTWMKGPSSFSATSVFGTQGVPSPANYPSGRGFGAVSWTDLAGNLWLFGGCGLDGNGSDTYLNELWMYNITTNEWTWMGGSLTGNSPGNFGTQGVPAPSNWPPGKCETSVSWVDGNGDLWTYGGLSLPPVNSYDDVWRYNIATNTWTWMSGQTPNPSISFTQPNYGILGVPSPANTPGTRQAYAHWQDTQGRFWMFGGYPVAGSPLNNTADMWMYDPTTLLWTWMAGTSTTSFSPTFTSTCLPGGVPAGTLEDRACWTDACGRFWSMSTSGISGNYSHLWFFDPTNLQFTWVTGTLSNSPPAVYGTQGVPAPANYPDGILGSNGFVSAQGDLWLFGGLLQSGAGSGTNLLWRYQPDAQCSGGGIIANLTVNADSTGCAPFSMPFSASGANAGLVFEWDFGDPAVNSDTATGSNPFYVYTTPGIYTVTLVTSVTGCAGAGDTSTLLIQVLQPPAVSLGNDTILCPGQTLTLTAGNPGNIYSWNTGATTQTISVDQTALYAVSVNAQGCIATDSISVTLLPGSELPAAATLCGSLTGLILDAGNSGTAYLWNTGDTSRAITVNEPGIYSITFTTANCIITDSIEVTGSVGEGNVYIPNSFTPNGDGLNDRFSGVGEDFTSYHLVIFNRWGELIFETPDPDGWDGNYAGQRAESDVYVYLFSYSSACTGGKVVDRRGAVTLIR
ncbi:MAG: gliding motility-associated C-terminal domain-containing protein [Bacteroidetes bacterium]|nr:gliding motility-associated C-terminal domain-containing protein [Bacteroidota bacterium]